MRESYIYFLHHAAAGAAAAAKPLQSCPTLCDPIDRSAPGSPIPGILQARTLEWVPGNSSGNEPACQCRRHEKWARSLDWEDPLEEVTATHYSILA